MTVGDDYLTPTIRAECERIVPEIEAVKLNDAATTYLFLKTHTSYLQVNIIQVKHFKFSCCKACSFGTENMFNNFILILLQLK